MKNNSVMKCCVCNNKKSGEFITIDNKKYHLCCIKRLKDNWNKLKEYITEANEDLYWTNNYDDILCVMQELEQGSDSNE